MLCFDSLHVLWLGKTSYQPGKPSVSLVQVLYMFAEWISSSQTENGNLLLHQTNLWWGVSQSHPFIVPTFTNPDNATALGCLLTWLLQIPQSWFTVNETFDPTLHLTMADVQVDSSTNAQSFRVYIKCSKTDPFCKGCFIFLGRYSFPLCPVVSLTNYLHLHRPGTRPLFIYKNGTPLSLSSFLQSTLQSAGIPWKFSGHSFQIGAATTTARKGLPNHLI